MKIKVPTNLAMKAGRAALQFKKNSPHVMFAAGVVGFGATVVLASKATLELDKVLEPAQRNIEAIEEVENNPQVFEYNAKAAKKDRFKVRSRAAVEIAKLYAPAIATGTISVACLTGAHIVLNRRNAGLMMAYAGVQKAFDEYRARVREDVGEEKELQYRFAHETTTVDKKKVVRVTSGNDKSMYARFFDETATEWQRNAEYNHVFLHCQQNYFNQRLHSRGHVFLNEVYDALGIERTPAGAVVGWVSGVDGGDNYIDFGLHENEQGPREFMNGAEYSILLDFNVDGVIYDKI